jgi:AcrR family transcriptional regulator
MSSLCSVIEDNLLMEKTASKVFRKMAPAEPDAVAIDGRHHRSIKTRQVIVTAFIDLIGRGHPSPTAEQIATHAQVGLRTVFRHFDDMETLYREITQRLDELMMPLVNKHLKATLWSDRLVESIERRCAIFDRLAPYHIAAQLHMHDSEYILQQVHRRVKIEQDILAWLLPAAYVEDRVFFEGLSMLVSLETWMRLRGLQGLSTSKAKAVVLMTVQSLMASHPAPR